MALNMVAAFQVSAEQALDSSPHHMASQGKTVVNSHMSSKVVWQVFGQLSAYFVPSLFLFFFLEGGELNTTCDKSALALKLSMKVGSHHSQCAQYPIGPE